MQNSDEVIRRLINETGINMKLNDTLNETNIKNKLKNTDKNNAIEKLNSMGLGHIADKLKGMSDDELINIIKSNPSILKKLNSFFK